MRILIVCGTFDDQGGKSSGYMSRMLPHEDNGPDVYNGGRWNHLLDFFNKHITEYEVVCWFPDVPNDKQKLLGEIKKLNPKCLLVTSKNNRDGKYTHHDLVARALNSKSNLLLEFREKGGVFTGTIHDPLGNIFVKDESRPHIVWNILYDRLLELYRFTRTRSVNVGEALEIPDEKEFFDIVKTQAEKFHELVHAVNSERLLGNASFRCTKGFPGFKHDDKIFVSRRNIDKRFIGKTGFVAVESKLDSDNWPPEVKYYGESKPSVDTPIQLKLFNYYKNIKFILHSHTYIKNALITTEVIPCGAMEEFNHIVELVPDEGTSNFYINLRGHGSLVLASDLSFIRNAPYIARPAPEVQRLW